MALQEVQAATEDKRFLCGFCGGKFTVGTRLAHADGACKPADGRLIQELSASIADKAKRTKAYQVFHSEVYRIWGEHGVDCKPTDNDLDEALEAVKEVVGQPR